MAEAKRLLDVMLNPAGQPPDRAEAGRRLAEIGDPRPGVGVQPDGVPDLAWSEMITAGKFQMGGDPDGYRVWGGEQIELPYSYWIARYPVTYAQYAAFVAAGGYSERTYWTTAGWTWKADKTGPEWGWNDPMWHISNHPVIGVTWYEAYACTCWLDEQRRGGKLELPAGIPENYVLRLPTEAEWEKAARYPDGRKFPWGNDADPFKLNSRESGIKRTCAVGIFAAGRNEALGVYDLSGNVLEWCLSRWNEKYQLPEDNDHGERVLRGGAWNYGVYEASSVYRSNRYTPDVRSSFVGFRVVGAPRL